MSRFFQVYRTDRFTGKADPHSPVVRIEGRDEVDRRFLRSPYTRVAVLEFDQDAAGTIRRHAAYFVNKTSTMVKLTSGEVWPDITDWVVVNDIWAD